MKLPLLAMLLAGIPAFAAPFHAADGDNRAQNLYQIPYGRTGSVLELQFEPYRFHYAALEPETAFGIALSEAELQGTFSFRLVSQQPEAIRRAGLRLIDAYGEIFQLTQSAEMRRGEWTLYRFRLSPETTFKPIFGGDGNRKIDYPVKLKALLLDFDSDYPETAAVRIKNISWEPRR